MPINPRDYPTNWKRVIVPAILNRSRNARGQEQCECRGECLKHSGRRCDEINATRAKHARGKIILTTSHLCHSKKCAVRAHMRSMCQLCHLLYQAHCKTQCLRGGHAVRWAIRQGKKRPLR